MSYEKQKDLNNIVSDKLKKVDFNFKERFGSIPKSIMKFKKTDELMDLIDNDDSEIGKIEGDAKARGGGYAKELRYSIYNPDQAYFIIDYYTEKDYLILDPFCGRVTRPLVSLYLDRKYIGFDTSSKTIALNKEKIDTKFPNNKNYILVNDDGIELNMFKDKQECVDAVFTCPPYYNIEKYSGEKGDLSLLNEEQYNARIELLFENLYRLIKSSSYKDGKFYPVIFTIGSIRKGSSGLIDMDFIFQQYAKKAGFILHDKLFTENNTPGAGFTFRRNYLYKFLTKNYETTLVFLKYKKES